jgi:hypothetical protein
MKTLSQKQLKEYGTFVPDEYSQVLSRLIQCEYAKREHSAPRKKSFSPCGRWITLVETTCLADHTIQIKTTKIIAELGVTEKERLLRARYKFMNRR